VRPSPLAAAAACALAGAVYGLPYRSEAWGPLAWIDLVPLLWACARAAPGRAALFGWLFGAAAFAVSSSSLVWTIERFLFLPRPVAAAVFAAYCAALGAQFGLASGLARRAAARLEGRGWSAPAALALAFPPLWVAVERLFPEEFPKTMAMTQLFHLPLVQALDLGGPAWLAWLLCAVNAAAFLALARRRWRPALAAAALLAVHEAYGLVRLREVDALVAARVAAGESVRVGVVQGSEPFQGRPRRHVYVSDLRLYAGLTRRLAERGPLDLIVWPEATFEGKLECAGGPEGVSDPRVEGRPLQEALRAALPSGAHLLLSALAETASAAGPRVFNVSVLTGPSREFLGAALKRHLLPFGEYLPGDRWLPGLRRLSPITWDLTPGLGQTLLRMRDGSRLGVLICTEDLPPSYARGLSRAGADLLVYQASDIWFRGTLPAWHLRAGSLRAVENRKFMVRAVESGVSAVIDPAGRVVASLGFGERGELAALAARLPEPSLAALAGDALYALAAALSALLLAWPAARAARSGR
jgi:apolipoprotein N-acyltransferase